MIVASATALYRLVTEQEWLAVAAQTAGISVSAGPVSAAADKTDSDDDDEFHDAKDYEDEAQVRGYFLVFVPTIREIRDFYREM
eukprot:SAG31_NODE_231_length_19768_cov_9.498170_15_plen_84_part_00